MIENPTGYSRQWACDDNTIDRQCDAGFPGFVSGTAGELSLTGRAESLFTRE